MMEKEQELRPCPRELLQLLYSYGSIHTVTGVVYGGTTHKAALDQVAALLASPDEQAEVVGYVTETALDVMRAAKPGWHYHMISPEPAVDKNMDPAAPLYASPPSVAKGGVTAMVSALKHYANPENWSDGRWPPEADDEGDIVNRCIPIMWQHEEGGDVPVADCGETARAALTAALAVGDEGIREVLRDALRFISNIDNAHPVVRKLRAALKDATHAE